MANIFVQPALLTEAFTTFVILASIFCPSQPIQASRRPTVSNFCHLSPMKSISIDNVFHHCEHTVHNVNKQLVNKASPPTFSCVFLTLLVTNKTFYDLLLRGFGCQPIVNYRAIKWLIQKSSASGLYFSSAPCASCSAPLIRLVNLLPAVS